MAEMESLPKLTEEQVADFLLNQRGFFVRHPELLDKLHLPHKREAGLVEFQNFQTKSLRRQIDLLKDQLYSLVSVAGDNAQLYVKLHQLTLLLLASDSTVEDLPNLMREVFQLDSVRLWWFLAPEGVDDEPHGAPDALKPESQKAQDIQAAETDVVFCAEADFWTHSRMAKLDVSAPECGVFDPKFRQKLSGDAQVTSVCVLPLGEQGSLGVLVLGSYGDRFSIQGEKVFLMQLMQLLSQVLSMKKGSD
jgi:uncharacterized protein YigA (DUF484 family)